LTVEENLELGLIGGYLLLNASGRPLEFHCTAPVRPNRAQEILYGPTLAPYLYGEQIGRTLLTKSKSQPLFVCTDVEAVLAARSFVSIPLAFVEAADQSQRSATRNRLDSAHRSTPPPPSRRLVEFQLAQQRAAVPADHEHDRDEVLRHWHGRAADLDLAEPFTRLHEAIEEAQRGAGR